MKKQPVTDAAFDVKLNPVTLPSGEVVAWGVAFPTGPGCERTTPRD
jgi:hypothetical protein